VSRGVVEEAGRRWAWASRHYVNAFAGEFAVNGFAEMENEGFAGSVGRHIGERLKAGVRRNIDNPTFTSSSHRSAKVMSESGQRLHIHLNFSMFLLGIMGKKFPAQTESCIIDEKVHLNTAMFKFLLDGLRTAGISQIKAENSALNLEFPIEARGQLFNSFVERATNTRFIPRAARASANAAPRPFEAPVMSAVEPLYGNMASPSGTLVQINVLRSLRNWPRDGVMSRYSIKSLFELKHHNLRI
jgi:hypothetical protein